MAKTPQKLPARLDIMLVQRSGDDSYRIRVTDERSQCMVVELSVSLDSFALAIGGRGHVECVAEYGALDCVGWKAENKEEDHVTAENLHEFEVDGWRARKGDIGNMHRRHTNGDGYRVTFFRHVPPEESDDES
jgi:hypothetical protein